MVNTSTADISVATGVPLTQTMERVLGRVDVISVQQTPRGWFQECLGCSARSEFKIYPGFNATMPGLDSLLPKTKKGKPQDYAQIGHSTFGRYPNPPTSTSLCHRRWLVLC